MQIGDYVLGLFCEAAGDVTTGDPVTNGKCWLKHTFHAASRQEAEKQASTFGWDLTLEYCPKHAQELHEKREAWAKASEAHYEAFKKGGPSLAQSGWVDVDPRTGEPLTKDKK